MFWRRMNKSPGEKSPARCTAPGEHVRPAGSARVSFSFRLAISCALLFGLLSVGGITLLYIVVRTHVLQSLDDGMLSDMREFFVVYDRNNMEGVRAFFETLTVSQGDMDSYYHLVNARGETLAGSKQKSWRDVDFDPHRLAPLPLRQPLRRTVALADARKHARVLEVRVDDDRYLQMGLSLEEHSKFFFHLRSAATLLILLMLAGGTLIGWLVARRAMGGIRRITGIVERVTGGSFGDRVPVLAGGDEISQLGRTFNAMAERVQAIMTEMRQMNSSIAHDLRSPITRIRGAAETTLLSDADPQEFAEAAGSIIEECDRLLGLINTTLDIAEAESGVGKLRLSAFALEEIARQAVEIFRPTAEDAGVRLEASLGEPVLVQGETAKIQRAVANLIDNALKFTPRGGVVRVAVSATPAHAMFSVQDTGPGISPEAQAHLFERFYRGDQSRHSPGHGLGLSLANAFVRAHGGEIRVESTPWQGSTFTILLPREPPPAWNP